MGNQEDSVDLEPSKMPEKEATNQESLNDKDTESNPEDQASKKRKEADTVIYSTEPMVGLYDGSTKKSRVFSDKDVVKFLSSSTRPPMEEMIEMVRQMGPSLVVDRLKKITDEYGALFSRETEYVHALELLYAELKKKLKAAVLFNKWHNEWLSELRRSVAHYEYVNVVCDQGYDEKIRKMEENVAKMKSRVECNEVSFERMVMGVESTQKMIKEAKRKIEEAKKMMVEKEGSVKAALASYVLLCKSKKDV